MAETKTCDLDDLNPTIRRWVKVTSKEPLVICLETTREENGVEIIEALALTPNRIVVTSSMRDGGILSDTVMLNRLTKIFAKTLANGNIRIVIVYLPNTPITFDFATEGMYKKFRNELLKLGVLSDKIN